MVVLFGMLSLRESVHSRYQAKNREVVGRRDDSVLSAEQCVRAWRGGLWVTDTRFDSPAFSGTLNHYTPKITHKKCAISVHFQKRLTATAKPFFETLQNHIFGLRRFFDLKFSFF
jgi:hypothetical protein